MRDSWRAGSLIAALLLQALAACGAERESPGATSPVTVRALLSQDPPSLSLLGKPDHNSEIVATQITDSLVQYDDRLELLPRVAESYEFSDGGRTLVFRLRPGVRWHDGRPVTAADVIFSVEQARDPAVENRTFAPQFADLVSLETPDERTIRARYSRPARGALEAWRLPLLPRHLAQRGAELLTGSYARHPVGCGPFRFVRYRPGEEIVLEANDDYWDGRPHIDRLVFVIYPDQRTAFQALRARDLDIMVASPDLWHEARLSAAATRPESFVYYRLNLWQIGWNMDGSNPFFADARVRRALLLALDRGQFIERIAHGLGRPGVTSFHPDLVWTDATIEPLPYDPGQAGRLLELAGWSPAARGVRERAGRRFRFRLMIGDSSQGIVDEMAAWLQQSWARVGIEVEIEKLEWRQFRERRLAHEFEATMAGLSFTPNPDQFELYHSSARDAGFNYGGLRDPEVDRLLESGRAADDPVARRQIYFGLQQRLHELQPIACLIHFATPVLHDPRLRGVVPSPIDHWRTTRGPREWRWVEDLAGG